MVKKNSNKNLVALICMAALVSLAGCLKENHDALQRRGSASASQPNYEFPPLASDTVRFPKPLSNTGLATYDSTRSAYIILLNGNYTVDATCFRDTASPARATNLMLYVNGNLVYDTGFPDSAKGVITLEHSMRLVENDVVYIRTQDNYHSVLPGGIFSISMSPNLMSREKTITVLNTLIETNTERMECFQTALKETEERDLKILFSKFKKTSKQFKSELVTEVRNMGGTPGKGTDTTCKECTTQTDVKVSLERRDRKAILRSCEEAEGAAIETYNNVLKNNLEDINPDQHTIISAQHALMRADHDKLKSMLKDIALANELPNP